MEENFKKINLGDFKGVQRNEFHNDLMLTGTEISVNNLPANVAIPFVHAHKENEEVYIFLSGEGIMYIDGNEFAVGKADVVRVDPKAQRCIKAQTDLNYICIQAKANSLTQFTQADGIRVDSKPSWA
ncbi:MAG: cupin domain-containing protein [Treponemataceae bacterium]